MLSHVIAGALGYLLGSFPTAYLLVRWKSNIDIRNAGSGNVGTLNSYVVTNSKLVGGAVLLLDLLKGMGIVLLAGGLFENSFAIQATAGIGAVLGHNFPVWLSFKGGRGLAPAAGVMLALGWIFVAAWGIWWFLGFRVSKNVNIGNTVACLATLLMILFSPDVVLARLNTVDVGGGEFRYFALVIFGIILSRHIEPVVEFVKNRGVVPKE